jgi:periplasmic protein TonB
MASDTDISGERFGFTIFMSACIHIMLIMGVGFTFMGESKSAPRMEITLAQYRSAEPPDEADFIAQENQTGSGILDTAAAPATPFQSELNDNTIQQVEPVPQATSQAQERATDFSVLTASRADEQINQQLELDTMESEIPLSETSSPQELSLAIASLQAQLDLQQQAYAKRPRKYTLSSASTQKRADALYLDTWRKHIESVGNLNYPGQARQRELYGNLRMMVALRPNGSVEETRILQSSGHQILDEAAVNIVQMAAPFEPFPEELREEVDILEIIRTWRFHQGNSFTSN